MPGVDCNVTASDITVGDTGTATLDVFGGITGTGTLDAGVTSTGNGTVDVVTGGVLSLNSGITIGDAGMGTVNQITGTVTSGVGGSQQGDLTIGAQSGSLGVYNLGDETNSTPSLVVYGNTIIGRDAGANSGSGTTTGTVNLAITGNGTSLSIGQYTDYTSANGGSLVIGLNGNGTVTQTDQSSVYLDHNLVLGANSGSSGAYTVTATSTTANSGYNLWVGSDLNVGGMQTDTYGTNFQTTTNGGWVTSS